MNYRGEIEQPPSCWTGTSYGRERAEGYTWNVGMRRSSNSLTRTSVLVSGLSALMASSSLLRFCFGQVPAFG